MGPDDNNKGRSVKQVEPWVVWQQESRAVSYTVESGRCQAISQQTRTEGAAEILEDSKREVKRPVAGPQAGCRSVGEDPRR